MPAEPDSHAFRSPSPSARGGAAGSDPERRAAGIAGALRLEVVFLELAACTWSEVAGVATDAQDRLFVFHRDPHGVTVFDPEGGLLANWSGDFRRPHGITVGPGGLLYCVDDLDHTVKKFTPQGELVGIIGRSGCPSDTGATSVDYRTIRRAGPPFHYPTNLAFSPDDNFYVADGYGNACIHKFAPDGQRRCSWGAPGSGPGEFQIPHGIAVDAQGRVWVADRENSRLQQFSAEGEYLGEWTDVARPCQVTFDDAGRVWVAELGYRAGMWPGTPAPSPTATGGRISVFSADGTLLGRFGGGETPTAPGDFFAPHDICVDRRGSVYVAEVTMSAGGRRGLVPADCHALQKFRGVPASPA